MTSRAEFGLWAKKERERLGISIRELSRIAGISFPVIYSIQRGEKAHARSYSLLCIGLSWIEERLLFEEKLAHPPFREPQMHEESFIHVRDNSLPVRLSHDFGDRVRAERVVRGLTIDGISVMMDDEPTPGQIANIENGRNLGIHVPALCAALDIPSPFAGVPGNIGTWTKRRLAAQKIDMWRLAAGTGISMPFLYELTERRAACPPWHALAIYSLLAGNHPKEQE